MTNFKEKELWFRGKSYKIAYEDSDLCHPSLFSFEDESSVRDDKWLVCSGECVLDVGSNYGSYTLTALSQGAARVFSWSPQDGFENINASLVLNNWVDHCVVYPTGLYSQDGWLDTRYLNNVGPTFLLNPPEEPHWSIIKVGTLDSWYENTFKLEQRIYSGYWIKLDVEGSEVEILKTSGKFITNLWPKILVENHDFMYPGIGQRVREFILNYDYHEVSTTQYHSVSHSLYWPNQILKG